MADFSSLAAPLAAVAAALAVVLLIVVILLWRHTGRLAARLDSITRGAEGLSLEEVLNAHVDKVYTVAREVDTMAARTAILEAAERRALARVGLVRFNPFEDTGGNQSFALAVTDAKGDGWVISSLHTRAATRVYAKSITGGKPEAQLSSEETEALRQAMGRGPGNGKGA